MPNLLGVTNPVPGHDSSNVNRNLPINPGDPRIQNAPDPSRVTRPDNRTEQQDSGDATGSNAPLRYNSNFQTFLQRLMNTPSLAESFSRLFLLGESSVVSSGLREGSATDMASLLKMLKMDAPQLLRFVNTQLNSATRFGGALFQLLRDAFAGSRSEGVQTDILQFMKSYSDFTSSQHVQGNLVRTLHQITQSIPASWGNQLANLVGQLENSLAAGDRPGSLKLLQNTILPFLASYTDRTRDMGASRTLISQLALDIARFEGGSEQGLLQAFHQLRGHTSLRNALGAISDEALLQLIRNSTYSRAPQENHFANSFSETASHAMRGESGSDMQLAFRQILSALLINESVYMPLNHIIIPLDWEGKFMFSELWVDPDTEDNLPRGKAEQENTFRFLFKLDIQDLGFFDMVLTAKGESVDLQVYCPTPVVPFSQAIQQDLNEILSDNGLKPSAVQVRKMERPLTLSSVFPKIFEGENSVNVKV